MSRLSLLFMSNRALAIYDAGGGGRPLHDQRNLASLKAVAHWSLTTLCTKHIKIGVMVVWHNTVGKSHSG